MGVDVIEQVAQLTEVQKWINEVQLTRQELAKANLVLATIADLVLGEDAQDRSDDALVKEVGRLVREKEEWGRYWA
jgi:hypothetical protein